VLRTETALRSYPDAAAASSTHFGGRPPRRAPPELIPAARIARHELEARNRFARFQAIHVGVLRRSALPEQQAIGGLVLVAATTAVELTLLVWPLSRLAAGP
jgi:hypothetical protein